MKASLKFIDRLLEIAAIASMGALVVLTLFSVLSRFIFKLPIAFSEEVGRFLFIWTAYLGAAITMRKNEHMKLDLFQGKLSPKAYSILQVIVFGLIAVFCIVLCREGTTLLDTAFKQTAPVSRIPLGVVYFIIPFTALCMVIFSIAHAVAVLKSMKGGRA
jgi:TRAP-type C4-dicarboxylate transport system permease small subunit